MFFFINLMATTHKNLKTEKHNLKKEGTEERGMETTKQKQQTETQRERINRGAELPENKRQKYYRKSSYINHYPKWEQTEFTNKRSWSRGDKKNKTQPYATFKRHI